MRNYKREQERIKMWKAEQARKGKKFIEWRNITTISILQFVVVALIIVFYGVFASFIMTDAKADTVTVKIMMYTTDVGTVSLTEESCTYPELINLPYKIIATNGDVTYTGCWNMELHSDVVQVAFPDDAKYEIINLKKEWFTEPTL
jgi:hypothetical protein